TCGLSVNLLVQPNEDLAAVRRCLNGVLRHRGNLDLEVVLVDATGSPKAHAELEQLARAADGRVRLGWIDHDPGAAARRNRGLQVSRGADIALLDASVELLGDAFGPLLHALEDRAIGGVGPFGLVTSDMRHFHELDAEDEPAPGELREVDALQNYLLAFRRADLERIGALDEHYRFYRILDLDLSYTIRDRVGPVVSLGHLPLARHRQ